MEGILLFDKKLIIYCLRYLSILDLLQVQRHLHFHRIIIIPNSLSFQLNFIPVLLHLIIYTHNLIL